MGFFLLAFVAQTIQFENMAGNFKAFFGCFLLIGIAEALHHFPGMEALNAFGFDHIGLQLLTLLAGTVLYILLTVMSYNKACENFERIDL